jgi:hypothetical protein
MPLYGERVARMQRSGVREIEASNPWISQAASRLPAQSGYELLTVLFKTKSQT